MQNRVSAPRASSATQWGVTPDRNIASPGRGSAHMLLPTFAYIKHPGKRYIIHRGTAGGRVQCGTKGGKMSLSGGTTFGRYPQRLCTQSSGAHASVIRSLALSLSLSPSLSRMSVDPASHGIRNCFAICTGVLPGLSRSVPPQSKFRRRERLQACALRVRSTSAKALVAWRRGGQ